MHFDLLTDPATQLKLTHGFLLLSLESFLYSILFPALKSLRRSCISGMEISQIGGVTQSQCLGPVQPCSDISPQPIDDLAAVAIVELRKKLGTVGFRVRSSGNNAPTSSGWDGGPI
jgi:hypothetical protein